MKKINIILILFVGVFFISCESNTVDQISVVNLNPTYSGQIGPIVSSSCAGCHSGGQTPNLRNYTEVKAAIVSGKVMCRIDQTCGGVMPPGAPMPQITIDMFKLWVSQGYIQ